MFSKGGNKVAIMLVIVMVMSVIMGGCGGSGAGSSDSQSKSNTGNVTDNKTKVKTEPIVLKYAHPNADDTVVGRFATSLAELVEERTEGRIKINVFSNSKLGTHKDMIEGVKTGAIEMGQNDFAAVATMFPDLAVFNVPYLYRDAEHAAKATNPNTSEVLQKLNERLIDEMNMRIIGSLYYGYRQMTNNAPIYKPADLEGKKMRANVYPVWMAMVEGMHAIPTPVDFTELPTALATNVVSGQENPLSTILEAHLYEMQKYLIMTNHMLAFLNVHINEDVWQKISPEDQKIIEEAIAELSKKSIEEGLAAEETNLELLKEKGMQVITEAEGLDMKAFQQSVSETIYEKFPQWKEYIEQIQSM